MSFDHFKLWLDGLSLSAAVASVVGLLPPLAALASLVWTCIQVYSWYKKESKSGN